MSDYDSIQETVFHYYEGYRGKNRERLEKAFAVEVANMMGYIKKSEGQLNLFAMTMKEAIDEWVGSEVKEIIIHVPGDVDGNCVADLTDLAILLSTFGQSCAP